VYEVVAVPAGVVTVTVTGPAPAEAAGAVILIVVAVFVLMVAAALPNVTEVAPARFVPVMLTSVPAANGLEAGEMTVMVGVDSLTFTHVIPDIPDPPLLITVKLTDQFPATNVCVALLVVLNCSHAATVRLFLPHFHDVGTLVDVSLNTIVNGAVPAQPCEVVLVATDVFVELKLATGARLRRNSSRAPTVTTETHAEPPASSPPIPERPAVE